MKILPRTAIHRPKDAEALFGMLADGCLPIAGGTELLIAAREGLLPDLDLVDISADPLGTMRAFGMAGQDSTTLEMGALLTHTDVIRLCHEHAPDLQSRAAGFEALLTPLMGMANTIANIRVRNQGTLGGNLCFGEPRSDWTTSLVALEADVSLTSGSGLRSARLDDVLVDAFYFDRGLDELVTAVHIPVEGLTTFVYRRWCRGERPLANVAGVTREQDGARRYVLAVGACSPTPLLVEASPDDLTASHANDVADAVELFDVHNFTDAAVRRGVARMLTEVQKELAVA